MPSTASPFGLRPYSHPSGVGVRTTEAGTIATGYATAIYQYAPIRIDPGHGEIILCAAGSRAIGCFLGVDYTDTNGRRQFANKWTASTTATNIVAYYTRDQKLRYTIQSTAAVNLTDMGAELDWSTATAGNATTGMSTVAADVAALTPQGNAGLRIIGLAPDINNAWGDTYTNLIVEISEHQDTADRVGYGSST